MAQNNMGFHVRGKVNSVFGQPLVLYKITNRLFYKVILILLLILHIYIKSTITYIYIYDLVIESTNYKKI